MQYNRSSFSDSNNTKTEHYWNDHRDRNIGFADNDPLLKEKNETPLQREIRLAKDAARAAERRRRETSPERRRRLAESAAHTAQKRKMETPEQREQRLAKDAARAAERRRRETETDRQKRLAADAARHASRRSHYRQERDPVNFASHLEPNNNLFVPNMPLRFYQPEYPPPGQFEMPMPDSRFQSSSCKQKSGTQAHSPTSYQSKYSELLNVIEDLGREIKPTYAGSKMAQERLKKGIMHARDLVRECLAEVEKSSRE